jgi:hypothetical protein
MFGARTCVKQVLDETEMTFLEKYQRILSFRVDKPKEVIFQYLLKNVKHYNIAGDTIQIAIKPTFFNSAEGRGFVNLSIQPNEGGSSTIKAEVIPTSITREGLLIVGGVLSAWTITASLISFRFNSLLTVVAGWIIFAIAIHLMQRLNQGKLENYVNALIAEMKHLKETRIA